MDTQERGALSGLARANESICDKVVQRFTVIGKELENTEVLAENVYTMDETGVATHPGQATNFFEKLKWDGVGYLVSPIAWCITLLQTPICTVQTENARLGRSPHLVACEDPEPATPQGLHSVMKTMISFSASA